jgi:hypothetical protein
VAGTIALSARHKRASGISSRYAKARHLPCTLLRRGAYLPTHVREGCPAGRGLVSWANSTHLSPKVRRFTPHSWSNGRQPPTATCGNARDQPPSQRHAAWKLHSIVRNREGDDELSRPEGPVASLPARIAFGSWIRKKTEGEISVCFAALPAGYRVVAKKTDSGPDFRLTRSRHPSASGRRIGPSAGDGWAARRDPETNVRVFYDAGLY